MDKRLKLHETLCQIVDITEPDGDRHVYFQPPESLKMKYDAIRYSRSDIENSFANNSVYKQDDAYEVVVIYRDPDSDLPKKVSRLPKCRFNRHYTANNLNHDVFILYN